MTKYLRDIQASGVRRLNELFNEAPYSTREAQRATLLFAGLNVDGQRVEFLAYSRSEIAIFQYDLDLLDTEVRADIYQRLGEIECLESVVEDSKSELVAQAVDV